MRHSRKVQISPSVPGSAGLSSAHQVGRRTIHRKLRASWSLAAGFVIFAITLVRPVFGAEDAVAPSFVREIRPILSDACFQCHGPDARKRKAGLRLDLRNEVFRRRDGGTAVVPGKPEQSELFQRIVATDDHARMPPPGAARQLTPQEIEQFRRWISRGAEWQEHWAYSPLQRPHLPDTPDATGFVKNEIDAFVLQSMREQGLRPAPEADRRTLIRRLFFDVTGLPPNAAEVEEFITDSSPDAWERLVDRALSSPKFGERMAAFWLDLVRYADTNGYLGDRHEDRDLYRDWVIGAFNHNVPFDEFTRAQLAGDLLPRATDDTRIASGYNRLLMTTREAGAQPGEYLARYSADRVRNFSSVWLGSTLGCATCHDHKYDPFTMRDFYSLAAVFADVQEVAVGAQPVTRFPTANQTAALLALDNQIAAQQRELARKTPEIDEAQRAWEASVRRTGVEWTVIRPTSVDSFAGVPLAILDDGSVKVNDSPPRETLTLSFRLPWKDIAALRLEALPDDSLPLKGPGWGEGGAFVLAEISIRVDGRPITISNASATHSSPGYGVESAFRRAVDNGWGVLDRPGISHLAIFELATVSKNDKPVNVEVRLRQDLGNKLILGRFQLSTTKVRPVRAEGKSAIPQAVVQLLEIPRNRRSASQEAVVSTYYRSIAPQLEPTRNRLNDLQKRRDQAEDAVRRTMISTSGTARPIRVLPRGDWLDQSGPLVQADTPAALLPRPRDARGPITRLDLADWVLSPDNPLPSRVFVNRLWKLMFTRGLVATTEDFGSQSAPPSHPELLDWLATEFIGTAFSNNVPLRSSGNSQSVPRRAADWDTKSLLRLILTSGTYRQSSAVASNVRMADPDNHWLARQRRTRLDAEMVRDNALAVSGLLSATIGGRSVRPYQPAGYWALLNRDWPLDTGENLYRRGVYTYWCRTFLHPSLKVFDAPTREECTAERPESNTPLQALVLLNDPTYVEAARAFAERILDEGGVHFSSRLHFAFREALSREPRSAEVETLQELYVRHRAQFLTDRQSALDLLKVGSRPIRDDLPIGEVAAWTSVTRAILNLHEVITRN